MIEYCTCHLIFQVNDFLNGFIVKQCAEKVLHVMCTIARMVKKYSIMMGNS